MSDERQSPDDDPQPARSASSRPPRPDRPAAPPAVTSREAQPELSAVDYLSAVSDVDDDFVIAPPPEADAFAHAPVATLARRAPAKRLTTQRTLIPILLTLGLLLTFTGGLRFIAGDRSVLGGLSTAMSVGLMLVGILLLITGVFNMLYVRAVLTAHRVGH